MKIIQALEDSNILLKGVTKTIKNETKEQKGWFFSMLLDTLGNMPPHPLTNFEIQKHYKDEPRFNGVFSRNNLFKKNIVWGLYNKSW